MAENIDFIIREIENEEEILHLLLDDYQKRDFYSASQN